MRERILTYTLHKGTTEEWEKTVVTKVILWGMQDVTKQSYMPSVSPAKCCFSLELKT